MTCRTAVRNALALVATLLLSLSANAQLFRTYVAPTGVDTNPCTLPAPCRLLPAALSAVADGGEIWMLDSANYNTSTVNITKSVTILAVPGLIGSVVAAGGAAISIATPGVSVALRNLVIVPLPGTGASNGIEMTNGARLTIENCLIANVPQNGIYVAGGVKVNVTDTTIRGVTSNGLYFDGNVQGTVTRSTISNNGGQGIYLSNLTASTGIVDIAGTTLSGNGGYGLFAIAQAASGKLKVSVSDSYVHRNGTFGLMAQSASGGATTLMASNNTITGTFTGIQSTGAGSRVWASGNRVSENDYGFYVAGGIFESAGNNALRNNGTDTVGTITVITPLK